MPEQTSMACSSNSTTYDDPTKKGKDENKPSANPENGSKPLVARKDGGKISGHEKNGSSSVAKKPEEDIVNPFVYRPCRPSQSDLSSIVDDYARALDLTDSKKTGPDFGIYGSSDVKIMLDGRFVLLMGDSVVRAMYKDLVHFLHCDSLVYPFDLQDKGERRFEGDVLMKGARLNGKLARNGIDFEEIRFNLKEHKISSEKTLLQFMFCTRFFNENIRNSLRDIYFHQGNKFGFPDFVLMNSGLWDLSRYGKGRSHDLKSLMDEYRSHAKMFMDFFFELSQGRSHLVIMSTLPVAKHCAGAFLNDDVNSDTRNNLRKLVREGNRVLVDLVKEYAKEKKRISYVDLHSLAMNLDLSQWWNTDGTHWEPPAHRVFSYALLSHISRLLKHSVPKITPSLLNGFYEACDEIKRYNIYVRWLVANHLRSRKVSADEVAHVWDSRRTGGSLPAPAPYEPESNGNGSVHNGSPPQESGPSKRYTEEERIERISSKRVKAAHDTLGSGGSGSGAIGLTNGAFRPMDMRPYSPSSSVPYEPVPQPSPVPKVLLPLPGPAGYQNFSAVYDSSNDWLPEATYEPVFHPNGVHHYPVKGDLSIIDRWREQHRQPLMPPPHGFPQSYGQNLDPISTRVPPPPPQHPPSYGQQWSSDIYHM